jgi:hypothetical protein
VNVIGAPVHLTTSFYDSSTPPVPVDPAAVTVTITLPDGTSVNPAAVKDSTGFYHYDFTPTLAGIHQFYFTGTGSNAGVQLPDIFTVAALTTSALISLADAKGVLNKSLTSHTEDDEILSFIHSATEIINNECGFTVPTPFTETVTASIDGIGRQMLIVSKTPVISVSAVTPRMVGMPTIDISTLNINRESGVLYLANWFPWFGPQQVTYIAGRTYVPSALQDACKLIVQYFWETQRGGSTSIPGMGGDEMSTYGGMPGFPTRALDLMRMSPYYAAPGLA